MSDVLERLAAANPASEVQRPPIEDVWRKVAKAPEPGRRGWRRRGRWMAAFAAVAVPVAAVLVVALPLGKTHPPGSHPAGTRPAGTRPAAPGAHIARSTLDATAQRVALQQLTGHAGSIAVIDPRTGAIEALAGTAGAGARMLFSPEATFDVVTAAAALDSGRFSPSSRISGASPWRASGSLVRNQTGQSVGRITLTDALSESVSTVFARVGDDLGATTMATYMKRFGFYSPPGIDQVPASGARPAGTLALPTSVRVALGPLAAGQGALTATSLQMAMVAAAVANGGVLASPHLIASPAGRERRVMSAATAHALRQMLRQVVTSGTATAANVAGLRIAGKTGTARIAGSSSHGTVVSFIAFAPADRPAVAVAVVVQDPHGGFGGTEAAPIAARVIRAVLTGR